MPTESGEEGGTEVNATLLKKEAASMRFDVARAVNRLRNPKTSTYRRAITLFELQIAMLACHGMAKRPREKDSKFTIRTDRRLLQSARALATLKLLQHAAGEHAGQASPAKLEIADLVSDKEVMDLINDLIIGKIGLERVRYAIRPRDFSNKLDQLLLEVNCVTSIVDFSMRFEPLQKRPRLKGGVTNALDVIWLDRDESEHPVYKVKRGKESARLYERRLRPVCAMLWLSVFNNILTPPKIHKTSFAKNLLHQAARRGDIENLSASYGFVSSRLNSRHYECPPLDLKLPITSIEFEIKPLPEQLVELM
jgi:hypothetical protein